MRRRKNTRSDAHLPSTWQRMCRSALLIAVGFPAASFGTFRLFLYLYLPLVDGATTPIDVTPNRRASCHPHVAVDDACRECLASDVETVRLCVQSDAGAFIGHAFLRTHAFSVGFRTNERDIGLVDYLWPWARPHVSYIRNDDASSFDFELTYRACPATMTALRESIYSHALSAYQVGNWGGGRNCATWAADRIRVAGLIAPPGDCPNRMARWMHSTEKPAILEIGEQTHLVVEADR